MVSAGIARKAKPNQNKKMSYLIKHTLTPFSEPETIAEVTELTEAAVAEALNAIPAHKSVVVLFEDDFDNPGFADVFTAKGETYSVEPAE